MIAGEGAPRFILGVNYLPRRKAMYWWSHFDRSEVLEEFHVIRDLGLDMVRIFLMWEDWQDRPDRVSPSALRDLETVCDVAAGLGLSLNVTFFAGHMSGPSWVPGWMLRDGPPPSPSVRQVVSGGRPVATGYANPFSDATVLGAAELLLHTVVARLKDHPAVGIWNLGNEPDLYAWPPDAASGRAWVRRMTALIRSLDASHPVTCGLHMDSLVRDNGLRVHDVFAEVDVAVMHGYPMYADWATGPLDPDFVPFLCALTSALSGKPTLMEEFGGPTEAPGMPASTWTWSGYGRLRQQFVPSEEELAQYLEMVLPRLVRVGALGALLWCFADYAPELYDRPPYDEVLHERVFGLVRPDGSLKPHAGVLRRFAASAPRVLVSNTEAMEGERVRGVDLDISPEEYYQDPLGHARRLYARYLSGAHSGSR